MVNLATTVDVAIAAVAVPERAWIRKGASLLGYRMPAGASYRANEKAAVGTTAAEAAVVCLRPQASTGAVRTATSAHVADQAKSTSQQPTSKKYAHTMTRIAAFGGGALGPHPARDPV